MNKKYKVLIVHNYYQIPGGEDTVVQNERNMLLDNGHEVVMYERHNDEIKQRGFLGKISVFFQSIFSIKTYREIRKVIKNENIDIVHVHNTLPLVSPSAYYAAFSCKVSVVQTVHNFRFLCPGATLVRNGRVCEECIYKGLRSAIKHKCYRNSLASTFTVVLSLKIHRLIGTYNKINGYIALTEFNKDKISLLIKDRDKIFVKPNFMKFSYNQNGNRKIENYFVFIGRLDKIKGINLLVEAWKEIKDSFLYVIGDGPEKSNIEEFIKENNLENVKLLGFMNRGEAFQIIDKCKAVIVPSQWYEGFPMTIIEAFSMSIPVIASDMGNLRYIVENNKNGLHFLYNDKRELINKVEFLSKNMNVIDKIGKEAFNTFINKYTDKINYVYLNDIYTKVIGDNSENL